MELIRDIVLIYSNYGFNTQVLAASLRNPTHVIDAAKAGAHIGDAAVQSDRCAVRPSADGQGPGSVHEGLRESLSGGIGDAIVFNYMSAGTQIAVLIGVAVALVALAIFVVLRVVRGSPEKRERKRRLAVHRQGRLGDALITEATGETLYYSYSIRGVQYAASQDITSLRERLPPEPERLIGVASLKYAPNNPANSILVCEEWSGIRDSRGS